MDFLYVLPVTCIWDEREYIYTSKLCQQVTFYGSDSNLCSKERSNPLSILSSAIKRGKLEAGSVRLNKNDQSESTERRFKIGQTTRLGIRYLSYKNNIYPTTLYSYCYRISCNFSSRLCPIMRLDKRWRRGIARALL